MGLLSDLGPFGARDAVVTSKGTWSYAALVERVAGTRSLLMAAGLAAGDVAGLEIEDEADHLVATLALLDLGARHVTLPSHDPQAVNETLLQRVGGTHWVKGAENVTRLTTGPAESEAAGEGALYLKTSGTTGNMNIVAFTLQQLRDQARRHPEYATERLLRLAAIEHNNSKRHRIYCALMGGANVFRPADEIDVAALCAELGVTCLDISRMHASDLAARGGLGRFASVKLRTGGSAVPIDVRRAIETNVTPDLYVRYASTESGAIAMARPGEHDDAESVGRPLPGVELEIVDPEGVALPPGESGRIRLRAPGIATGYLGDAEQTASRFRDGWFWPGDVGTLRDDGSLIVLGRQDDMMILNGINIFPGEIERVLERHPAVHVAAALPVTSSVHGQIPVAGVELVAGASVTPLELQRFAREHLALRAPRRIVIFGALPRNSQGKVLRREIAQAFARKN